MHYFVEFCHDKRLRAFLAAFPKNSATYMFKTRGGGGVKGYLNNVKKKLRFWRTRASASALISNQHYDQQLGGRRSWGWEAGGNIWVKKFWVNLRKANLAKSLNQGFVRFESSLHPYFTIFVGRLGNYFKLHPLLLQPAFHRRTFPSTFHLAHTTHLTHVILPDNLWLNDGCIHQD